MKAALSEGRIFARAVLTPSGYCESKQSKSLETLAAVENRKLMREVGIATRTNKENRFFKQGNRFRSLSMLSFGSPAFADVGYLLFNPDTTSIHSVYKTDCDSGRGKKNHFNLLKTTSNISICEQLGELRSSLKLGGSTRVFSKSISASHNEIIFNSITYYDAIYFTEEPTSNTQFFGGPEGQPHPISPFLQAVFLRNQYQKDYLQTYDKYIEAFGNQIGKERFNLRFRMQSSLPIFRYSSHHNKLVHILEEELTDEKLMEHWIRMCQQFIHLALRQNVNIHTMQINYIKILSMYGKVSLSSFMPGDNNYSIELQERINAAIEQVRQQEIMAYNNEVLLPKLKNGTSALSDEVFFYLLHSASLQGTLEYQIKHELNNLAETDFIFTGTTLDQFFIQNYHMSADNYMKCFSNVNESNQQVFYKEHMLRIYTLAYKLNLTRITTKIQEVARRIANESFDKISHDLAYGFMVETADIDLRSIACYKIFLEAFHLEHEIPEQIHNLISKSIEKSIINSHFEIFPELISKLQKLGWLTSEIKETIIHNVFYKIPKPKSLSCLKSYLDLMILIELNDRDIVRSSIEDISFDPINITESQIFENEIFVEHVNHDQHFFKNILKKISLYNDVNHIDRWIATILVLQKNATKCQLFAWQISRIREEWITYYNIVGSDVWDMEVIELLNDLVKINELLPIPDQLVIQFNQYIDTLSKYSTSVQEVKMIVNLDKLLHFREERSGAMSRIISGTENPMTLRS